MESVLQILKFLPLRKIFFTLVFVQNLLRPLSETDSKHYPSQIFIVTDQEESLKTLKKVLFK